MGDDFVLLAGSATFDIIGYPDVHSGPSEVVFGF
jgi:hypothetical protein